MSRTLPRQRLNVMVLGMLRVRERSGGFRNIMSRLNPAQKRLFRLPLFTKLLRKLLEGLSLLLRMDTKPSPHLEHHDVHENVVFDVHSPQSSHQATPAEDDFLGSLSNVEVISRAYQTLGHDVHLVELDHLRSSHQRVTQDNEGLTNKLNLLDSAHRMFISRERVGENGERSGEGQVEDYYLGSVAQAEADRQKLVQEFIPAVVKRLHTSVKYRQSLAAQVSLCFTARWLRGLSLGRSEDQVSDSYLLLVADLMKISPDVPTSPPTNKTRAPNADGTDDVARTSPPPIQETVADSPFGTTT
ncbi:hypothetical protein Tco_1528114 [Tanacetum coccineum]